MINYDNQLAEHKVIEILISWCFCSTPSCSHNREFCRYLFRITVFFTFVPFAYSINVKLVYKKYFLLLKSEFNCCLLQETEGHISEQKKLNECLWWF